LTSLWVRRVRKAFLVNTVNAKIGFRRKVSYFPLVRFGPWDEVIIALKRFSTAGIVRGWSRSRDADSIGESVDRSGGKKAIG
jgi:hypothetical protein